MAAPRPTVRIDPDLKDLSFQCRPDRCDARCCQTFHVEIDGTELDAMLSVLDEASARAPALREADGEYGAFYEEEDDDVFSLVQDDNGCVFLFEDSGARRCAIHAVCLNSNLPLERHKPLACLMWPLDLTEDDDGALRLGLSDGARPFACVTRSRRAPLLPQYIPLFRALSPQWPFPALIQQIHALYGQDLPPDDGP